MTLLMLALLLVAFVKALSAWSLQHELKAALLALSNPSLAAKRGDENPRPSDENQSELRRLVGSHAAFTTIRADGETGHISQSSDSREQLAVGEEVSDKKSAAFTQDVIDKGNRTSLDSIASRAKGAGVELGSSQTTGMPGTSEPQSITMSVKGSYSALRAWLIEITDADPHLLLSGLQIRRERQGQSVVAGEIKFVRIDPGARR